MSLLVVIPARGGSKGIRRKNLQTIDGVPLVIRAARTARELPDVRVVVSTDDAEIASICQMWGIEVDARPAELAADHIGVMDVVRHVKDRLAHDGPTMCVQPTVVGVTAGMLHNLTTFNLPVVAGTAEHHLMWKGGPLFIERRNRQDGAPNVTREVGVYFWPGDITDPEICVAWTGTTLADIDTPGDLTDARHTFGRRRHILIDVETRPQYGTGHLRRQLTLAVALQHHDIVFGYPHAAVLEAGWPADYDANPEAFDLHITDHLDSYVISPCERWVTFEDEGPAARKADLCINALYGQGAEWAVLRPEFRYAPPYEVRPDGRNVFAIFGGTDPAGLGERFVPALEQVGQVDWIRPGADRSVAAAMRDADVVVTSAGRTVFEAAAIGVPAVVVAQNARETTHTHLGARHGNLYLGWGPSVDPNDLARTVDSLLTDRAMRTDLSEAARKIPRNGVDRIVWAIDGLFL